MQKSIIAAIAAPVIVGIVGVVLGAHLLVHHAVAATPVVAGSPAVAMTAVVADIHNIESLVLTTANPPTHSDCAQIKTVDQAFLMDMQQLAVSDGPGDFTAAQKATLSAADGRLSGADVQGAIGNMMEQCQ